MTDDLIRLCIVLITASLNLAIFALICFFIYQVINQEPKKTAARVHPPRPQKPLTLPSPPKSSRGTYGLQSGKRQAQLPNLSIPNSINAEQLNQRSGTRRQAKAINRGVPYKILRLMHNDTAAADRLFEQVSRSNPDKDERWCWEKVLWDLQRDHL